MRPWPFSTVVLEMVFLGRCAVEVGLDVGFQGGLVALEGEQVVGLVGDDLVGDLDLAAHGVDGDQGALELLGLGELVEQLGNGGDLVGLLRHADLGQGQPGVGGVGAEHVQRLDPLSAIVGAPRGLAVDGNEVVAVRPLGCHPALEAAGEQGRIDAIDQAAQPALAGNAVMERGKAPQELEMVSAPCDDLVEIVARGDGPTGDQQQNLVQRVGDPPGLAGVVEPGKVLKEQPQPRPRHLLIRHPASNALHPALHANRSDHRITTRPSTQIPSNKAVNLTSEPCRLSAPIWTGGGTAR